MAEVDNAPVRDNPEVRHENSDVDVHYIVVFGAGLLVMSVLVLAGVYWLMASYESRVVRRPPSLAAPEGEPKPAEFPRLQVSPPADLTAMRAAEEKTLGSYGWVDQEQKIVRIPIERAMELIVKKGLPMRPKAPSDDIKRDTKANETAVPTP